MTAQGVIFENKSQPVVNYRTNFEFAAKGQKIKTAMQAPQRAATVVIRAEKPALFLFVADAHLFSAYHDYPVFRRQMELAEKHRVYLITLGDLADFFHPALGRASAGTLEQFFTPEEQALAVAQWLGEWDKKGLLTAVVDGNHEGFLNTSGLSFSGSFLRNLACPLLSPGGFLTLKVGEQTYRLVLSHRWRGNSRVHPAAAAKTLMAEVWPEADAAVVGHTHRKAIEMVEVAGSQKIWIVAGSYKAADPWALASGWGDPTRGGGVCLALWPKEKRLVPFWRLEEAVDVLF